jgi:hypothetical protein
VTCVGPNMRVLVGEEHPTRAVCVELKLLRIQFRVKYVNENAELNVKNTRCADCLSGISPREFPQRSLRLTSINLAQVILCRRHFGFGKGEVKRTSVVFGTFHPNSSTIFFNKFFAKNKAKSSAFFVGGSTGGIRGSFIK